jgi:hypothetical protein
MMPGIGGSIHHEGVKCREKLAPLRYLRGGIMSIDHIPNRAIDSGVESKRIA